MPRNVGEAIQRRVSREAIILLHCLTLLASNVLVSLPEPLSAQEAEGMLEREVEELLHAYATSDAMWIIVSNEVGLGLVPLYPLGRVYRDALGRVNQRIAREADEVILMVAGLPITLK